jgi:hypothetical protein
MLSASNEVYWDWSLDNSLLILSSQFRLPFLRYINPPPAIFGLKWGLFNWRISKFIAKKIKTSYDIDEHEQHIQEIVEKDPQLCAVDIIDSLASQFEGFSISKSQMNYHLKNNMFISVKKPTFEPKIRNSDDNLQTRYE